MNGYTLARAQDASRMLLPYKLRWFEDICDPLDYEALKAISTAYAPPVSTGEAIFSASDARNVVRYAELRAGHDVLTFHPAHCYGIPEFVRIIEIFEGAGWTAREFLPMEATSTACIWHTDLDLAVASAIRTTFSPSAGLPTIRRFTMDAPSLLNCRGSDLKEKRH